MENTSFSFTNKWLSEGCTGRNTIWGIMPWITVIWWFFKTNKYTKFYSKPLSGYLSIFLLENLKSYDNLIFDFLSNCFFSRKTTPMNSTLKNDFFKARTIPIFPWPTLKELPVIWPGSQGQLKFCISVLRYVFFILHLFCSWRISLNPKEDFPQLLSEIYNHPNFL